MRCSYSASIKTLALTILLAGTACAGNPPEDGNPDMVSGNATYLALGDSYTIGESVEPGLRWPVQLVTALNSEGVEAEAPVIIARTGWTTDELQVGIAEAGLAETFDLVSLLIGVNNQYRGRDLEEYRTQFVALLNTAIGFAGGRAENVLVLSIPDWGVMPFAEGRDRVQIGLEIDAFNRVNREESLRAGARYVDVTGISREAREEPGLVAEDGLHPSGAMYARWAEASLPAALEILDAHRRR
jgi:lysophospholipase L1-like esterase